MHELPVTERILKIVLKHAEKNRVRKVLSVQLEIGKLSDLENDWIQRYFDYLSKGTVAEGAKLRIEKVPITIRCSACSTPYETEPRKIGDLACPACGEKEGTLISGREYTVKAIEVQ